MSDEQSMEISTTITITNDMLEGAIRRALHRQVWDDDVGEFKTVPADLDAMVKERLREMVDGVVGKVAKEVSEREVEARVNKILDEGFPVHNQWGSREGTKTMAQLVGEIVFKKDSYNDGITKLVRHAMRSAVDAEVKKHIASISGEVATSMKAAASEALAKWMKRTVGM
jgi:hypothetical protein